MDKEGRGIAPGPHVASNIQFAAYFTRYITIYRCLYEYKKSEQRRTCTGWEIKTGLFLRVDNF